MKTVPGKSRIEAIGTVTRLQSTEANSLAWKGTVLLVGMISLLVLLSGCYTVIATSSSGRMLDRFQEIDEEVWDETEAEETAAGVNISQKFAGVNLQAMMVEEPQVVGVQIPDYGLESESGGVGVRYRQDYEYDPEEYGDYVYDEALGAEIVSYRRSWIRRLYVDCYYNVNPGFHYRPGRLALGWSAGWLWGGFGFSYGLYEPCWYDPFYWDYWWSDPFYYYDASYSCYWYPWRWGYVYHGWYWPSRFHYNYWCYDPFYHDPYWGSNWYYDGYWYSGRGTGVVVSRNYERRSADRRRGLVDARGRRDGSDGSRSRGAGTVGDRTRRADDPLTNSRRPVDRTGSRSDDNRPASGTAGRTRQGGTATNPGQVKIRTVPPVKEGIVEGVRPLLERPTSTTARGEARNRNTGTETGRSTSRSVFRTLGQIISRAATSGSRTSSRGSSSTGGSRGRSTGSRTTRGTSSRPPRTTTSRPPPSSRPRTTSSRTTSRTTSSRPPRTTTSRPPPLADSGNTVSPTSEEPVGVTGESQRRRPDASADRSRWLTPTGS